MVAQSLDSVQYRLIEHYIGKLRQVNAHVQRNRKNTNYWFQQLEQDWPQIRKWQQWTAARSVDSPRSAQLCASFGTDGHEYVFVRQSPVERLNWYRESLAAAQHCGDSLKERRLLYHLGSTAYQTGSFDEAERCSKRLLELGDSHNDPLSLGDGWFLTGNMHSHRTELDAAEAAFRTALNHYERCRATIMTGHAVQGIARVMLFRGQYAEALTYATRYLRIIEAAGREFDYSLAYHTLSNIHTRLGNLDEAKKYALNAVTIARRLNNVRMIPSNLLILGYAELAMGDLDAAWDHFQEVIVAARAILSNFDLTAATYSLGDVCLRRENYTEALHHYQQALTLATESRIAAYRSLCSIAIAYIHALNHDTAAAHAALREGAAVALQIKSDILLAKALIPAMKLWQDAGRLESAAEWSGLLLVHPEHAEPALVEIITKQLEAALGTAAYKAAAERGKQLKLDDSVKLLVAELESSDAQK